MKRAALTPTPNANPSPGPTYPYPYPLPLPLPLPLTLTLTLTRREYLAGEEWIVDSMSRDGEHAVLAIWRYDKGEANGAPFCYYGAEPVGCTDERARAVWRRTPWRCSTHSSGDGGRLTWK